MIRRRGSLLLLLLAWPAAWADDKPKDKPPTAKEQYAALQKEFNTAQQAFLTKLRAVKTPEDQQKLMKDGSPELEKVFARFNDLADKNPKDPVAIDALTLVLTGSFGRTTGPAQGKAVELLRRDHVASPKVGALVQRLGMSYDGANDELLKTILAKNPDKSVQAETCLALAQGLRQRAELAKRVAADPDLRKQIEQALGKETTESLKKVDVAKLEGEAEARMKEFADKHVGQLKAERLTSLCQQLSYSSDKGSEALLRTLEKHEKKDIQAMACLGVAQVLKARADEVGAKDPKAAEKLLAQAEEQFNRAVEKYADVKLPFRGTVGDKAKGVLYEIRHLAVGKPAPVVEGEDQDGKKFTLADYKGKVVFLDFWNEF